MVQQIQDEATQELLSGAYDLHVHAAPSPFNRLLDDTQLLHQAGQAGMAGILLKSHYESTAARAELANRYAGSTAKAYGALALNWPVGGLNAYAVHNALKCGAKIIFMPTRDAANSLQSGDMPGDFFHRPGLTILDSSGTLKPEIYDIFDVVLQYDAVVATGHLSPHESVLLCRKGRQLKVQMLLTHPEFSRTRIPSQVQRELADIGVLVEKCWYNLAEHEVDVAEMAANINLIGAEHCYMSTDRGQSQREPPVQALQKFISALMQQGISFQQLSTMLKTVPAKILGR